MILKGILGIGCSFLWGEGLYYYNILSQNYPKLSKTHNFVGTDKLTHAHIKFKNKNRFLQIVSDNYGMWNISNIGNGGSNVRNIQDYVDAHLVNTNSVGIRDFDLIIYQFTSSDRDFINQRRDADGSLTGDTMPVETQIEFINDKITQWENLGIKVVTLSWYPEFPNHPLYKKYFKNRHVDIEVDGEVKNSFEYFLMDDKYNITIKSDFSKIDLQTNDMHFNMKGHKCIANSIIKKLNDDNWKPTELSVDDVILQIEKNKII
jgi:hypothetical protein